LVGISRRCTRGREGIAELGIKGNYLDSWSGAKIEKTGGVVQYITPADFRSMIERDKNTALEIAKKEGLAQRPR
jgi:hypothetical protein